ncbi:MAG: GNAT family N-acetyltransferase [Acidisphaera sp.]|nr:GNAT family N-acetyltransferase [Acidisphaera sp.]
MPAGHAVSIVEHEGDFLDLREEWRRLFARARTPYASQGFEWSRCVWETMLRPRGGRLRCVVIRAGGRLRLAWPTAVLPHHRFWSVLVPLGSGEYTDVLAEDGPDARELAASAWKALRSRCRADFIFLERVRVGSLLSVALGEAGLPPSRLRPAPCVTWNCAGNEAAWDGYYRGLAKNLRSQTERRRRRLAERGSLAFEVVGEGERYRVLAAWMLAQKASWLTRTGRHSEWIGSPEYAAFVQAIPHYLAANPSGGVGAVDMGAVKMFALCQGDAVLAAELNCISGHVVEFINGAYDPAYEQLSPGHILRAHTLRWAFDRGLTYDFRPGEERYKDAYANDGCDTANYYLTNSLRGRLHQHLGAALKRLPRPMRPPIGR